jgi:hypothetical protein
MVFRICVEKDSETEKEEWLRKWKGRVVFCGSDVVDENWDVAVFRELGSTPATMVAAKFCDLRGFLRGHINEIVDATQAYTQSLLGGTKTWVSLPRDEWPESWNHMKRPVCPLVEALCGHPDAGDIGSNFATITLRIADLVRLRRKTVRGVAVASVHPCSVT